MLFLSAAYLLRSHVASLGFYFEPKHARGKLREALRQGRILVAVACLRQPACEFCSVETTRAVRICNSDAANL